MWARFNLYFWGIALSATLACQSDVEKAAADFSERICKCSTRECIEQVRRQMDQWIDGMATQSVPPTEDDRLALERAVERAATCIRDFTMGGAQSDASGK